MNIKKIDIIVIGFAIFATFFGAGNLIFPPYLGVLDGNQWYIGFLGFLIGDVVLSVLAIIASAKNINEPIGVLSRCGKKMKLILGCVMMISVPLLVVPRTASTAFEISILPLFQDSKQIVFSIIFFIMTFIFAVRPSKVIDYIGKFLTPLLILALIILIVKGIISPIGTVRESALVDGVFANGLSQGYQTIDAIGGAIIATLIISTIIGKGYTKQNEIASLVVRCGCLAAVGLLLIYGGLCFIGSTVSNIYGAEISQTTLVTEIVRLLLGEQGKVLFAVIVVLACLTTAIGTTAAACQYFAEISHGKLKYEFVVAGVCIASTGLSTFGVSSILKYSLPIVNLLYPAVVTLIILTIFTDHIKNDNVFKIATYVALISSLLSILGVPFMDKLPFASLGLGWILPVAIAAIIGNFINTDNKEVSKNVG